MRRAPIILGCALLALAGFGGRSSPEPGVSARIQVTEYSGKEPMPHTRSFSLTCNPTGGTLPLAARICRDIQLHPEAMLNPRRIICLCGPYMTTLSVSATADGRTTQFSNYARVGVAVSIFFHATEGNPAPLARLESQLRCYGDAMSQATNASVRACANGLWTPRWRRLIRLAEATPSLAPFRPVRLFPADIGARECAIEAGGPAPGRRVPAVCGIALTDPWSKPMLSFSETWTAPDGRRLRHSWHVVFQKGRIISTSETGPPPPQRWR